MPTIFAFGLPGPFEMVVVGLVVLLLFGSRLPSVMRSLGVGITEFRKGIKGEIDADGNAAIEDKNDQATEDSQSRDRSTSSTSV